MKNYDTRPPNRAFRLRDDQYEIVRNLLIDLHCTYKDKPSLAVFFKRVVNKEIIVTEKK